MMRTMAAAIVLLATPAGAQAPAAPAELSITLQEAIASGLSASHRLAEAAARGDAAEAAAAQRRAAGLPQVNARASYLRTNHVDEFGIPTPENRLRIIYPDIPDNVQTRLDLQWPIYTAGRLDALERAARADARAAQFDVEVARADLRLEITRAYWALVTAGESLAVVNRSVERMNAHLQDVRHRLAAGLVPPSDVLSVEAQSSRQRMLGVQAQALRDSAQEQLAYLVGAPPGTAIRPTSPLEEPDPDPDAASGARLEEAAGQRAERAALDARLAAAGERAAAARAARRPTLALSGGVDWAQPNPRIFPRARAWNQSWDAGVHASWTLFDGGRASAELAGALAGTRAASARLADFDRALDAELRQRRSDAASARAAVAAAGDAVRAAAEAERVVGERFAAGVAITTDLVDARLARLQAELDRTQALAAVRLADARLARALGR
ncbi:MAG: TolC family protein [Acidobacteria bacterium]|nr:TolC family protein [Acidobacteriota bacterium]